jgi:lipopolysaccharide/colanic/teichoic acid biosynthesis glycosyltransferase
VGRFIKRHYLNELPQIFNIVKGDMSFVGIRPIAQEHYFLEVKSGHVRRKLLKAGIFSQTHVRKGTPDRFRDELDYEYIRKYITLSAPALLWLDIRIITRGILMVVRGENKTEKLS